MVSDFDREYFLVGREKVKIVEMRKVGASQIATYISMAKAQDVIKNVSKWRKCDALLKKYNVKTLAECLIPAKATVTYKMER